MSVNEYCTHRWYQHEEFNREHRLQKMSRRCLHLLRGRPLLKPDGRNNVLRIQGGGSVTHNSARTTHDARMAHDPPHTQCSHAHKSPPSYTRMHAQARRTPCRDVRRHVAQEGHALAPHKRCRLARHRRMAWHAEMLVDLVSRRCLPVIYR